ncbi:MAG: hypothetical protein ACT4PJ_12450 [Gemmatimonadaceae bacterium]
MSSFLRVGALVEIAPAPDGAISESLLALAYAASESSFVMLAHRGVSARVIDRTLDRIVPRYGLRANGVIYIDGIDTSAVVELARKARVVIACTPSLQLGLSQAGIAFTDEKGAVEALDTLVANARVSATAPSQTTAFEPCADLLASAGATVDVLQPRNTAPRPSRESRND